jgi:ABC-type glycerol-3-phosphate transport system permease component
MPNQVQSEAIRHQKVRHMSSKQPHLKWVLNSLRVALANTLLFALVYGLAAAGFGPSEPWALAYYILLAIALPLGGLLMTLFAVRRDLEGSEARWGVVLAIGLAVLVFVLGGRLLLGAISD